MRDIIQSTMIIYEVLAKVTRTKAKEYREWLGPHTHLLLKEPGFLSAEIWEEVESEPIISDLVVFGIRYRVQDLSFLNRYFSESAPRLRKEALEKFGSSLSVSRRVWKKSE